MKKLSVIILLCLVFINQGCLSSMLSNLVVPTPNPRPAQKELTYQKDINTSVIGAYKGLSTIENEDKTHAKLLAKYIDRESKRAHAAGSPDKLAMIGNQIIGNTTRPMVESGIKEGLEVGKGLLASLGGGASLGGIGLWQLLRGRKRMKIENQILRSSMNDDSLNKAREAAKHTDLEGKV
jgi:hypothetical protein